MSGHFGVNDKLHGGECVGKRVADFPRKIQVQILPRGLGSCVALGSQRGFPHL